MKATYFLNLVALLFGYCEGGNSPWNNETSIFGLKSKNHVNLLTIASFVFNHDSILPSWIKYIMGDKSVFYYHDFSGSREADTMLPVEDEEFQASHKVVSELLRLSSKDTHPICSIELLGYALLDQQLPFVRKARRMGPVVGMAEISIDLTRSTPHCYYRAIYENWRIESEHASPHHWSVVFYCPIHTFNECKALQQKSIKNEFIPMSISFSANNTLWFNRFDARISSPKLPVEYNMNINTNDIAICVVIPYTSTDVGKRIGNKAILQEWIRYYLALGLHIMIYDRDGINSDVIHDIRKKISVKSNYLLHYHPYTIRGLFAPAKKGITFDNNEYFGELQSVTTTNNSNNRQSKTHSKNRRPGIEFFTRFETQGHDKVLTLTHCRFELKSIYGIENSIVADYDEFIYCPKAGPSANAQSSMLRTILSYFKMISIEQVTFQQRVLMNTTISTRDCIIEKAKKLESVFLCYGTYEYVVQSHSIKSIYTSHACPLTGYHQACPTGGASRAYNCPCISEGTSLCNFVHLSTNSQHFKELQPPYIYSNQAIQQMLMEKNEIYRLLYTNTSI